MDHEIFLNMFGKSREAAEAFGKTVQDINIWKKRGIPARYWHQCELIARERGWNVTAADLARAKSDAKAAKVAAQ